MDPLALRAANRLVGNPEGEACLEIMLAGPRLEAVERCLVAVTGASFALSIFERPLPMNTAVLMRGGETLEFGERKKGMRAYLAVAGGIDVPVVMGSRSTDLRGGFGGFEGRLLRTGDILSRRTTDDRMARAGRTIEGLAAYYEDRSPTIYSLSRNCLRAASSKNSSCGPHSIRIGEWSS